MEHKVPVATQREMVALYATGKSLRAVAAELHWSKTTVKNVLISNGVSLRLRGGGPPRKLTDEEIYAAAELYQAGLSLNEVGRRMGLYDTAVMRRLKHAGIPTRSKARGFSLRRFKEVSEGQLTDDQQELLGLIERMRPKVMTTSEIGSRTGLKKQQTLHRLRQLQRYGLIEGRRSKTGSGRPAYWRRTDLQVRDVFDVAFTSHEWGGGWLPIGPFRDWVSGLVEQERRHLVFSAVTVEQRIPSGAMSVLGTVAARLGVDERRLHAVLYEQKNISLAVADRALQNAGTGTRLEDLWPELGREDELDPEFFQKRGYGRAAA